MKKNTSRGSPPFLSLVLHRVPLDHDFEEICSGNWQGGTRICHQIWPSHLAHVWQVQSHFEGGEWNEENNKMVVVVEKVEMEVEEEGEKVGLCSGSLSMETKLILKRHISLDSIPCAVSTTTCLDRKSQLDSLDSPSRVLPISVKKKSQSSGRLEYTDLLSAVAHWKRGMEKPKLASAFSSGCVSSSEEIDFSRGKKMGLKGAKQKQKKTLKMPSFWLSFYSRSHDE